MDIHAVCTELCKHFTYGMIRAGTLYHSQPSNDELVQAIGLTNEEGAVVFLYNPILFRYTRLSVPERTITLLCVFLVLFGHIPKDTLKCGFSQLKEFIVACLDVAVGVLQDVPLFPCHRLHLDVGVIIG